MRETSGDGLIPAISQDGRSEEYWNERNALVDAVKAVTLPAGDRKWVAANERTPEEQAQWAEYGEALDALKAFDERHGGSPVL